ncbi:hypothetical protein GA0070616_3841 [Micromonospora nigra]|uniref:Uncharacterized protein n=1 Tax=Micromonospora nigra TaxID=145857 RepID=A0A1C6SIT1_9ACTN|nr:hypothetical protein GA0070616_3841 [Micromonospora nigra]
MTEGSHEQRDALLGAHLGRGVGDHSHPGRRLDKAIYVAEVMPLLVNVRRCWPLSGVEYQRAGTVPSFTRTIPSLDPLDPR